MRVMIFSAITCRSRVTHVKYFSATIFCSHHHHHKKNNVILIILPILIKGKAALHLANMNLDNDFEIDLIFQDDDDFDQWMKFSARYSLVSIEGIGRRTI
jgi:hypothetical protein